MAEGGRPDKPGMLAVMRGLTGKKTGASHWLHEHSFAQMLLY
jgi:hypothetical protein